MRPFGASRPATARLFGLATVAAALAATAIAVRRAARRAEHANPPLGRFIEVDGVRLHHMERGRGEPLVLLHGNGAMIQDFLTSGLVERAAERYRVIVFDRPGFGYSERPRGRIWTPRAQAALLAKALERLGIERPLVVGHSWGTLVALALALDHPAQVRGLVLASGYYYPSLRLDVPLLAPPAIPVLGDVLRYTVSPLLGWLLLPLILRRIFAPAPVAPRFAAAFPLALTLRPGQLRAAAAETALLIPAAFTLRRRYDALAVPAVILAGAADRLVDPDRQSVRLGHCLGPRGVLRLVPAAGHMVHQTAPEQTMAAIDLAAELARAQHRSEYP